MKSRILYWKEKISYNSIVEWYNFLYCFKKDNLVRPKVESIDDTIRQIITNKCSVSRFGDGEILLAGQRPIRFQRSSKELSDRLIEILQSQNDNHLVCISDVFDSIKPYNRRATRFWRTHFYLSGHLWNKYLIKEKTYYNTFMTRPYMDFKSKELSGGWFTSLKEIWNDRDVVFVEGEKSRLGIGNDLFDNVRSVKRILGPATNAFDRYSELLEAARRLDKDTLILIALGPTATVLAYDLYKLGYQAIDVGHVDVEYEWYNMGATRKVRIPSKHVNEAADGRDVGEFYDEAYQKQIIDKIV